MKFLISVIIITVLGFAVGAGYYYFWLPRTEGGLPATASAPGNPYPAEDRDKFYLYCKSAPENCDCMWNYLEANYSYEEFLLDKEEGLPRMQVAAEQCATPDDD